MVLKSSIRTSASPRWQGSDLGLKVTQNAYFSLMAHTKHLLLVTISCATAEIEVSFWTDARRRTEAEGQTDVEVEIVI